MKLLKMTFMFFLPAAVLMLGLAAGASAETIICNHHQSTPLVYAMYTYDGTESITIDESGNMNGSLTIDPNTWPLTGTRTGSNVTYTTAGATYTGTYGFAMLGTWGGGALTGVDLFQNDAHEGFVGNWTAHVNHTYDPQGPGYDVLLEITSAEDGVIAGNIFSAAGDPGYAGPFTGTYDSGTSTFSLGFPGSLGGTVSGVYGTGWHGRLTDGTWTGDFLDYNMTTIPEPSVLALLLTGVWGAACFRFRRKA